MPIHHIGQPKGDLRNVSHQQEPDEDGQAPGKRIDDDILEAHPGNPAGDKEVQPDGWGNHAQFHIDRHDDPEMDGIDAQGDGHRKKQGHHNHNDGAGLHKVPGKKEQDIDEE